MFGISKNINVPERWARAVTSLFLIPSVLVQGSDLFSFLQTVVGIILIYNALSGICWTSRIFGIKTCDRN